MEPLFSDRVDAGRRLADRLLDYRERRPVVLALPRGGVPVGFEVAKRLAAPLDLVLVRKIGAPMQPELALGAVADGGRPFQVLNEDKIALVGPPSGYLDEQIARKLREIEDRRRRYLGERSPIPLEGCSAILVDDGIATGATVRVALQAVRDRRPAKVVLAVPVAPPDSIEALRADADEVVCLERPPGFFAISVYYRRFPQVADDEVTALLRQAEAAATQTKS